MVEDIKKYAKDKNVPIIQDETKDFLINYIKENNITKILEIGSAIGYSSIIMAMIDKNIKITTIEKDLERSTIAKENIKKLSLSDQITLLEEDAKEIELNDTFDLIFIDAAKAQNIKFFTKFSKNLKSKGTIITDNMNFHGLVNTNEEIKSRNLRQLVRKINDYKVFLEENKDYKTIIYNIGDGIAISIKLT